MGCTGFRYRGQCPLYLSSVFSVVLIVLLVPCLLDAQHQQQVRAAEHAHETQQRLAAQQQCETQHRAALPYSCHWARK